jgi:hypothetical protein
MTNQRRSRSVLLIGLNFHNYDQLIAADLNRLGFAVRRLTYRGAVPIIKRFQSKLLVWAFYWLVYLATFPKRLLFVLRFTLTAQRHKPDAIIAVNPSFLIAWLLPLSIKRRMAVWLMDPVTLYPQNGRLLSIPGPRFTYDPKDAERYKAHFLPLFADLHTYEKSRQQAKARTYLFSFVGALYGNRAALLERLAGLADRLDRQVYFGGECVRLTTVKRDLATGRYPRLKTLFHRRRHSHDEIVDIYSQSDFVVNVHNVGHQGLSMRTFEALALGCMQIIDVYHPDDFPFNRYPQAFHRVGEFLATFNQPHELARAAIQRQVVVDPSDISLTSRLERIIGELHLA